MCAFADAVQAWFATFFKFSIEYVEDLKHACVFLEKFVMKRNVSAPSVVVRLANKVFMGRSWDLSQNSLASQLPVLDDLESQTQEDF